MLETARGRRDAKNKIFNTQFNDRWIMLLTDPDVDLHFVLCTADKQRNKVTNVTLHSFKSKAEGARELADPRVQQHWTGYSPTLVRYEELTQFPDHHRREHWKFQTHVLFVGTEKQMDWIAQLTVGEGICYDGEKGLYVPGKGRILRPR